MIILRHLTRTTATSIAAPIFHATAHLHFNTPIPYQSPTNPKHYDELIDSAGRRGDFAAVRCLLEQRTAEGCFNTKNTFKFISAATDQSTLDRLLETLSEIPDWFAKKNAHDSLIASLSAVRRTSDALRAADSSAKSRAATSTTFGPIINALARKKQFSEAWKVFDVMRAYKIPPTTTSYNYVLTAYCVLADVESAADALVKMEEEGLTADSRTYDALVLGACNARKFEGALVILRRMVREGVVVLDSTYAHVIKGMVGRGYCARVVLEFVRAFGSLGNKRLDIENYRYLVKCLVEKKRFEEAKLVEAEMDNNVLINVNTDDGLKGLL